jgi:hypothetical protein
MADTDMVALGGKSSEEEFMALDGLKKIYFLKETLGSGIFKTNEMLIDFWSQNYILTDD